MHPRDQPNATWVGIGFKHEFFNRVRVLEDRLPHDLDGDLTGGVDALGDLLRLLGDLD